MSILNSETQGWEPIHEAFNHWIKDREEILDPALSPKPTIKVLIFLALLDAKKACTYEEIREIFKEKNIIKGVVPDNTLRTSILNLGKTLDKFNHSLELKSLRGNFELIPRIIKKINSDDVCIKQQAPIILLLDPPAFKAEDIASELIEKTRLSFQALYFLERSARWWEIFSHSESQIRIQYDSEAWVKLGIRERIFTNTNNLISFVSIAPREGLSEIELLKKILSEKPDIVLHYLAIESSQRLLREHINLLKESLATEISNGRIICAGVIADIFSDLRETLNRAREAIVNQGVLNDASDFIPESSALLVTYLGNCLGNHYQDQETEILSNVYSTFQNRPLEFLIGVSVMRSTPDEYKRSWDDFLLQTPRYLLENNLFESSYSSDNKHLSEFTLPEVGESERCPSVIPESYIVRHGIKGQIYRFYYKLEYDLALSPSIGKGHRSLPKGTPILLYNIVKYDMKALINGIEACGLFNVKYNSNYHQIVDTPNGKREYAVFSAFLNK